MYYKIVLNLFNVYYILNNLIEFEKQFISKLNNNNNNMKIIHMKKG